MNTHSQSTTGNACSCSKVQRWWHAMCRWGVCTFMHATETLGDEGAWHLVLRGSSNCWAGNPLQLQIKAHEKNKSAQRGGWVGGPGGGVVQQRNVCSHQGDSRAKVKVTVQQRAQEQEDSQEWWVRPAFWNISCVYMNLAMTCIPITPGYSTVHMNNPQSYVEKRLLNNLILKFTFDSLASTSSNENWNWEPRHLPHITKHTLLITLSIVIAWNLLVFVFLHR